jgi:uncharacterized Tic20 family protein
MAALVACIGIPLGHVLGPLVVWLAKRAQFPEIDESAKEALNFQITATLGWIVVIFLAFFITTITVGLGVPIAFILLGCYGMAHLVLTIGGILAVDSTGTHRYPYTIRFLR